MQAHISTTYAHSRTPSSGFSLQNAQQRAGVTADFDYCDYCNKCARWALLVRTIDCYPNHLVSVCSLPTVIKHFFTLHPVLQRVAGRLRDAGRVISPPRVGTTFTGHGNRHAQLG